MFILSFSLYYYNQDQFFKIVSFFDLFVKMRNFKIFFLGFYYINVDKS